MEKLFDVLQALRANLFVEIFPLGLVPVDSPAELEEFIRDYVSFLAKKSGISRPAMASYIEWTADRNPCRGFTKKGRPCRNGASSCRPDEFVEGISDRCIVHTESPRRKR